MNKRLNIENQDKLRNNCGECGEVLTDESKSGWFRFYHTLQIEVCKLCNEKKLPNSKTDKAE